MSTKKFLNKDSADWIIKHISMLDELKVFYKKWRENYMNWHRTRNYNDLFNKI